MSPTADPTGVLVIRKPTDMTSHDAVAITRSLYHTRKVGHTGTLDPMATGVLVILLGRAAKAAEYLSSDWKEYRAVLRLGLTTDTEDTTGTVLTRYEGTLPSEGDVRRVCESFVGAIRQVPPMYSALKRDGKKLVDLARQGVTVEREAREITVDRLDVEPTDRSDEYVLKVRCSSGTYVRTLCADIGAALGCGGAMAALDRHVAGRFTLADAVDLDTLRAETDEQRLAHLLPLEQLFADLPALSLPAFYSRLCKNGCTIRLSKLRASHPEGQLVRLLDPDGVFFALGLVVSVTGEDGASTYLAVRAEKFFVLEKGDASNA